MGKFKNKILHLSGKMDQYQEAITFAEAGQPEYAEDTLQETKSVEESRKLVVVGKESTFSRDIIDYAIDMAETMSYEIVALNTAPLSCETFQLSSSRNQICTDFQMLSEANVQLFREEAEKRGISFTHVVRFSESSEVLSALRKEIGEFDFVVSEEEHDAASNRAEEGERPRTEIFVYSML
jgi:hypothetical protein